jgi:GH15 family glucan-1,4-alpha-glucosidase
VNAVNDLPISDYALVGDTRTGALVSSSGSIDWMCVPQFDGEPVFGRLIEGEEGGSFSLKVEGSVMSRRYLPRSAVLETQIKSPLGAGRLVEGMVTSVSGKLLPQLILVRRIVCEQGRLSVRLNFDPRLGLPARNPTRVARRENTLVCEWGALALGLVVAPDIDVRPGREASVDLSAGSSLTVVVTLSDRSPVVFSVSGARV